MGEGQLKQQYCLNFEQTQNFTACPMFSLSGKSRKSAATKPEEKHNFKTISR